MLPTRLPVPLPGSSVTTGGGAGSDVRPIAQWIEPARSGAALAVTVLPLTIPGFYYGTDQADGSVTSLWLRKEEGATGQTIYAEVFLNSAYVAPPVVVGPSESEAVEPFGFAVSAGDDLKVYVYGPNSAILSGVLRTPSRLFRLSPAAIGRLWLTEDGEEWEAPPEYRVLTVGTWESTETYVRVGGVWTKVL